MTNTTLGGEVARPLALGDAAEAVQAVVVIAIGGVVQEHHHIRLGQVRAHQLRQPVVGVGRDRGGAHRIEGTRATCRRLWCVAALEYETGGVVLPTAPRRVPDTGLW